MNDSNKRQAEVLPQISVITVCLNGRDTLPRAIESFISQSYMQKEYIIIDGASRDGTQDLIKSYAEEFEERGIAFRWVSEKDRGIYDAMNKGIEMANGELIGFLNCDDYYECGSLEAVGSAAAVKPNVGIFYGFLRVWMQNGKELQTYRYRYENYLLDLATGIQSATQHPTCFVRREVYEQIGAFDLRFPVAADYDFLIRAMRAGVCFHALDTVLSNFVLGGASTRMNQYERLVQRLGVLSKNEMLTESDLIKLQRQVRYQRVKRIKTLLAKLIFRL